MKDDTKIIIKFTIVIVLMIFTITCITIANKAVTNSCNYKNTCYNENEVRIYKMVAK